SPAPAPRRRAPAATDPRHGRTRSGGGRHCSGCCRPSARAVPSRGLPPARRPARARRPPQPAPRCRLRPPRRRSAPSRDPHRLSPTPRAPSLAASVRYITRADRGPETPLVAWSPEVANVMTLEQLAAECRRLLQAHPGPDGRARVGALVQTVLEDDGFIARH